jgi:hypothetical protein
MEVAAVAILLIIFALVNWFAYHVERLDRPQ